MVDRRSRPGSLSPSLAVLTDQQIADKEAENGLLQFDQMFAWIDESLQDGRQPLSPDRIREFQRLAIDGLEAAPGQFREEPICIDGSVHDPRPWEEVPGLVEEMCGYLNASWADSEPLSTTTTRPWTMPMRSG